MHFLVKIPFQLQKKIIINLTFKNTKSKKSDANNTYTENKYSPEEHDCKSFENSELVFQNELTKFKNKGLP